MNTTAAAFDDIALLGHDVICHFPEEGAPLMFIEPNGERLRALPELLAWACANRPVLDRLICAHGGVVLRGFPISEAADFGALTGLFPSFEGDYLGGVAPRAQIAGQVMESTRLDKHVKLRLHSEMAYMQKFPLRIAFFSKETAEVGGETIVADTRGLLEALPPALREKVESLGVMTVRNFAPPSGQLDASVAHMDLRGWDTAFESNDRAHVELLCKERGLEPIWNEDGSLTVVNRTSAVVAHPVTGQKLYRSNLHSYTASSHSEGLDTELVRRVRESQQRPSGTFLGDGQPLAADEIAHFNAFLDHRTRAWPWKNGDVMILDNLQTWHGRNPYEGSRQVQVAVLA